MVDTVKILGGLLSSGVLSRGSGGDVLTNVLGAALGGGQQSPQGGGLGGMLGSVLGGGQGNQQGGGGLGGLLGSVLGGGQQQAGGAANGLNDLLGSVMGGSANRQPSGGMGGLTDLLGSVMGGGQQQGGSLSELGGLGGLIGASVGKYAQTQSGGDAGDFDLGALLGGGTEEEALDQASLLIRAMIAAAKADGQLDASEQEKLMGQLGDIDQEEADFIRSEMANDISASELAKSVPDGMGQQIYAVSLMSIDLDTNEEAQYLHELAQGLGLDLGIANQIHEQLGAPQIYS